jgi:tRNA A-37 threonylcarbamoyl transferase component Bud32
VGGNCPACLFGSALSDEPLDLPADGVAEEMPTELGDYEILGEIGRGGTSVVYRARQRRLNRIVALKTLHGSALISRDAFERLQTEAQAVARLDHPNIVPLYEVGRHAGTHFLTLRYFEHGSLAQALKQRRFTPTEAARFLATAARAVHHAHSRGVLHRDLKPSNFLLDEHGAPHVADFGLAKLADSDSSLTLSTSVLGTPAYMAPEQAAGNAKDAGTPADIYALGAVLFELLTGRAPFLGKSALEVLRLVADAEPPRPTTLVPGLDRDLEAVCLRCLEKDPARRYASAAALADDLERWLRHEPLSIRPVSPSERAVKWVRRRPLIAALSAACVAAVVFGATGILWQNRRAVRAAEQARRNAYLAEMVAANQAVGRKDWATIRDILERTRPAPGEPDLRGWEWRYLWGASRSAATVIGERRPDPVRSMALLPDGRQLAVGREESGFELWDIQAGQLLYTLPEAINQVVDENHSFGNIAACRVATVPGTSLLAYTDCRSPTNAFVRLWDTTTRTTVRSLPLPWIPRHLAVSLDGRRLACSTMGGDNRVLIFEVANGALLRTIRSKFIPDWSGGHSLMFTPDGSAVTVEELTVERRGGLRLVEVATGQDRCWLPMGQDYTKSAAISADGRWLAMTGGFDRGQLRIWDLTSGQIAHESDYGATSLQFDPQGSRLFVGLGILRVPEFTFERILEAEESGFSASAFAQDGRSYITAKDSGEILRWDLEAPARPRSALKLELPVHRGTWLPGDQGALLVATNGDCHEALAPHFQSRLLPQLGNDAVGCLLVSPVGPMAIARKSGNITLHRLSDYSTAGTLLPGTNNAVTRMEALERRGLLAAWCGSSFTNRTLQFWDHRKQERVWEVPLPPVDRSFAVSAHEGVVYEVFSDHLIGYDPIRRRSFRRDLDHQNAGRMSFSPNGRWAFCDGRNNNRLLDATSLKTVARPWDIGPIHGSDFWANEPRLLLSGCQVMDLESHRLLLNLGEAEGFTQFPKISPGGGLVVEKFNHGPSYMLWRAPSWEEIRREEAAPGK